MSSRLSPLQRFDNAAQPHGGRPQSSLRLSCSRLEKIRFLLVGAGVFVVDFSLFLILTNLLELQFMLARSIAFLIAVVVSWLVNRNWTFSGRLAQPKLKQLTKSLSVAIAAASMNLLTFYTVNTVLFERVANLTVANFIGFALGVLAGLIVNWLGANYWTFNNIESQQ
ncbi:GtrA family protein [Shewanella halifaxensis]|uniref:GtrA family protein n=1 Tax=Shewanella halifaxensis TaxID=271098 RepID=UPI000D59DF7F|nr:GtrA family protein [Shewanella halifaxensis]